MKQLRELADHPKVELLVVGGDVEVPLVIGDALTSLNKNHSSYTVGLGDRFVMFWQEGTIEDGIILFDPPNALRSGQIEQVDMASMIAVTADSSAKAGKEPKVKDTPKSR